MHDGVQAGLRLRSPVHGLERRNLGPVEVLAQSVSCAAPAAGMASVPAIVAATAGGATAWSFLVTTALVLMIAFCVGQFTRRMAVAGSLYSLTAKGLGPGAAFASGGALLAGYAVLVTAAVTGAAIYLDALLARLGLPVGTGPVLAVCAAAVTVAAGALILLGVRLSARIVLLVEAVSITLMVVVFTVLLGGGPAAGPAPGPDPGLGGVAAGVVPALAAFIGFEAATALGVEARRPYRSVPRAVLGTAVVVAVLSLFAAYAQVAGSAGGGSPGPAIAAATARGSAGLAIVLDLGIATSFFACAVATGTVLVRVLFSMARDGILPRALGRTHPRSRTPHVAILVALPLAGAVPVALLTAGAAPDGVLMLLLSVASAGFLVAYLLVCLAAPLFLRRIGELTAAPVVATTVIVPVLVAVSAAYLVSAWGGPVPVVLGVLLAAVLGWYAWLRARRPGQLRGIGVYDEPSVADVHGVALRHLAPPAATRQW